MKISLFFLNKFFQKGLKESKQKEGRGLFFLEKKKGGGKTKNFQNIFWKRDRNQPKKSPF
jgi:hypothetical protein